MWVLGGMDDVVRIVCSDVVGFGPIGRGWDY